MRVLFAALVIFSLLLIAGARFLGADQALSAAFGAGVSTLNMSIIALTWRMILAKKLVALMIVIIVFKFALLVWILYAAARSESIHLGWFALGLGMIVPSSLVAALWKKPAMTPSI